MNHRYELLRKALLIALVLVAQHSGAQELWGKTRAGMSEAEVMAIQPQATPPSKPSRIAKTGAEARLQVAPVELVGEQFVATLYFVSDRLVQVTLSPASSVNWFAAERISQSLLPPLRQRYGAEIAAKREGGSLPLYSYTWISGETKVLLLAMGGFGIEALLNVIYTADARVDANKL